MKINGEELKTLEVYSSMVTVPDSYVVRSNKIGGGNGEAKFYLGSKKEMYTFFGEEGFTAKCFMLKKDLLAYLIAIKGEYTIPSQDYRGKDELPDLWEERMSQVLSYDDVIEFTVVDQKQINGPRGYVNSRDKNYQIIRTLALPLVSYVYIEKVGRSEAPLFYWKLFVDFETINELQNGPLVFKYGKQLQSLSIAVHSPEEAALLEAKQAKERKAFEEEKAQHELRRARDGQGKYRAQLLEQCPYCPITMVSDERLLIASHIKPWAASNDVEKIDPYNGYMLSPLYDKLFDRGFITFTENKHMIISDFISPYTWKKLNITNDTFIQTLPMDEQRIKYLEFHHTSVFKGSYTNEY